MATTEYKPSEVAPFVRFGKRSTPQVWRLAARHNLREALPGKAHNIDPTRSHLNVVLNGPSTAIALRAMAEARIATRSDQVIKKNTIRCIEILFSLPHHHPLDEIHYFQDCVSWAGSRFGTRNVMSAVIHRDEPQPHCHVLMVPMVNGRLNGSALLGHGKRFIEHRVDFFEKVAVKHGLRHERSSAEILTQAGKTESNRGLKHGAEPMLCSDCACVNCAARKSLQFEIRMWLTKPRLRIPTLAQWLAASLRSLSGA